jgi:hypothetical protein
MELKGMRLKISTEAVFNDDDDDDDDDAIL